MLASAWVAYFCHSLVCFFEVLMISSLARASALKDSAFSLAIASSTRSSAISASASASRMASALASVRPPTDAPSPLTPELALAKRTGPVDDGAVAAAIDSSRCGDPEYRGAVAASAEARFGAVLNGVNGGAIEGASDGCEPRNSASSCFVC